MNWQIDSIIALQKNEGLTSLMQALTFLGREEFFLLLIPLVYLCADTRTGIRLGVLLLLGDALNFMAKLWFHAPRPYWVDTRIHPLATETSYGLPSSHAQNGISIWLYLTMLVKKPWAWIVAVGIILLVSLSRVYLGVHFWTDIFGGWLLGLLFLILFARYWPRAETWFGKRDLAIQILASAGFSLLLLFVGTVIHAAMSEIRDPAVWRTYAEQARSLQPLVSRCGGLFGLGVGWALSSRWADIEANDGLGKRLLRFVIGIIGVLICWKGLQAVLPREPENIELFFRFFRYGLISLWVTFLAPWLFLELKLAERRSKSTIVKPVRAKTTGTEKL